MDQSSYAHKFRYLPSAPYKYSFFSVDKFSMSESYVVSSLKTSTKILCMFPPNGRSEEIVLHLLVVGLFLLDHV